MRRARGRRSEGGYGAYEVGVLGAAMGPYEADVLTASMRRVGPRPDSGHEAREATVLNCSQGDVMNGTSRRRAAPSPGLCPVP